MQERAGYESDRFRLVVYDRKSGQIRNLAENFDHWVEAIAWTPDSQHIYFTSEDKGELPVYRIGVSVGDRPEVTEISRGANDELALSADGRTLICTRMSARAPNEVYKLNVEPKQAQQLSHLNDAVLSQVAMQPLESFWFAGAGGTKVQGFIIKPPNFDPQKKSPMKFLTHPGPQGQLGADCSSRWHSALFSAAGDVC